MNKIIINEKEYIESKEYYELEEKYDIIKALAEILVEKINEINTYKRIK